MPDSATVENSGVAASSPIDSLAGLLAFYDLEGGDNVFIDTGVYTQSATTVLGHLDAGDGVLPITLRGSTNRLAGGTVMGAPVL